MWTLEGKRARLFESIAANSGQTRVRIKTKPSRSLLLRLLEQTAVKEIFISPGLWKTVPAKVRDALTQVGVRVVVEGASAGRPPRYPSDLRAKALDLLKQKKNAREIAAALRVPLSAVYWWKTQAGLVKRRRKKREGLRLMRTSPPISPP